MKYDLAPLMRLLLFSALLGAVVSQPLPAQPEPQVERKVRFLPVGELPPFRQDVRDGVRYELEPPAGSIPPRTVMMGFDGEDTEPASLRLGRISEPMKVPNGTGPLVLRQREAAADSEPWLRLTRPEAGDFLVLLWRDGKAGTWEKVSSLVLPDDHASAPAGSVRVINISPYPVRIALGAEKIILEAGKSFRRTVPKGIEQPFQILLPDASGNLKTLHSGVVTQNAGERSLVLLFRADGESPRRPVKVSVQRELAPQPPPPPKS
jgi:hypothetical protein